jgi:hypothetical protein
METMKAAVRTLVLGTLLSVLGLGTQAELRNIETAQVAPACNGAAAPLNGSAFTDCARAAAEKYQDRSKAIRDGYRPIGRDFPAMGEHWIRITLVFDGVVDPTRPEVLNYVLVDGRPKLVGLGFAAPLLAGELAPEAPAGRDAWHDHSRTIEDETVLPHTDPVHAHHGEGPGPRLAMLHTWLWAPNPDGVFAADNWGLAYVRLGLAVPATSPPGAAKALSLLTGGVTFFAEQFAAELRAVPLDRASIDKALQDARTKVEAVVRSRQGSELSVRELSALDDVWQEVMRVRGVY